MPELSLKILSTLAVKGVIDEITPALERAAGCPLDVAYDPTAVMLQKIRGGAKGDAAILTEQGIEQLTAEGRLIPGSRVDLAHSLIGLAVRTGAPKPDISTVETLKDTLRSTPSLVYSRGGASGIFFAGLLGRLGLAEIVDAKATIIPGGFTAQHVARGEAEFAIQQISELMVVPGVEIVGPLPEGAQESLLFCAAVFADTAKSQQVQAVLRLLAEPATATVFTRKGLLPVAPRAARA